MRARRRRTARRACSRRTRRPLSDSRGLEACARSEEEKEKRREKGKGEGRGREEGQQIFARERDAECAVARHVRRPANGRGAHRPLRRRASSRTCCSRGRGARRGEGEGSAGETTHRKQDDPPPDRLEVCARSREGGGGEEEGRVSSHPWTEESCVCRRSNLSPQAVFRLLFVQFAERSTCSHDRVKSGGKGAPEREVRATHRDNDEA